MRVFKLVEERDGGLFSWGVLPPYEVEYVPQETVRHSNMFAFDTLENARAYAPNSNVWEAETSGIKPAMHVILTSDGFDFFGDYWGGKLWSILPSYLMATPEGTVLCDDLKLIREVIW